MTKDKTIASAGLAGAIVGAGITAAAVALSDKKNRDKAAKTLEQVKVHAAKMMHKTGDEMEKLAKKADKQADNAMESVTDLKQSMKEPADELKSAHVQM